jgi:hypothetical protein
MTRTEYERRVQALKEEFAPLFSGNSIGVTIPPGWLPLVERACIEIDAALTAEESQRAWFVCIAEKVGGLSMYMNVRPIRYDFCNSRSVQLRFFEILEQTNTDVIYHKISHIVMLAEDESYSICAFCGAPGRLRKNRNPPLTLCGTHVPYTYHHLEVAFEQLTDQDRKPTAPRHEQIAAALQAQEIQFRAAGITRLGLLPPASDRGTWRLVVENGHDDEEVLRIAESLVAWPLELAGSDNRHSRHHHGGEVAWILPRC